VFNKLRVCFRSVPLNLRMSDAAFLSHCTSYLLHFLAYGAAHLGMRCLVRASLSVSQNFKDPKELLFLLVIPIGTFHIRN
jgi:hypothetical protein